MSKAAKLRALMPLISQKIAQGMPHEKIVETINKENNLDLTLKTFSVYLYRFRKDIKEGRLARLAQVPPSQKDGNLSILENLGSLGESLIPQPTDETPKSLDEVLNSRKRGEAGDEYFVRKPSFGNKGKK